MIEHAQNRWGQGGERYGVGASGRVSDAAASRRVSHHAVLRAFDAVEAANGVLPRRKARATHRHITKAYRTKTPVVCARAATRATPRVRACAWLSKRACVCVRARACSRARVDHPHGTHRNVKLYRLYNVRGLAHG